MAKVPLVTTGVNLRQIPRGADSSILPVTSVAAEHESSQNACVLMKIGTPPEEDEPWHFVLSPPAAAQLARELRKAVKEYLRHTPGTE